MPPQQTKSQLEVLAQQIGSFASLADNDLGLRNPNDLYVSVMRTRVVEDALIDRYGLQEEYGQKLRSEVRKRLESNTEIDTGKDGLIVISVRDHDPRRAANLANSYAEQLKRVTLEMADQEATGRKEFFRKQLEITQNDLANAEQARGSGLVAPCLMKGAQNRPPFEFFERQQLVALRHALARAVLEVCGQIAHVQDGAGTKRDRTLDGVLEFAHVSRVVMGEQNPQRLRRHPYNLAFAQTIESHNEVVDQERNVLAALAEGRQNDPHHIDSVVQVLTDRPGLHQLG